MIYIISLSKYDAKKRRRPGPWPPPGVVFEKPPTGGN